MRAVVQRVSEASVVVEAETVGRIERGLMVLVGVAHGDGRADVDALVDKLAGLRIFSDEAGRMNRSVTDVGGSILLVSQFTLLGDVRRGRRPAFVEAADPSVAEPLLHEMAVLLARRDIPVQTGRFGAKMTVSLVNDGPVTIVVEVSGGRVVSLGSG